MTARHQNVGARLPAVGQGQASGRRFKAVDVTAVTSDGEQGEVNDA